MLSPHKRDDLRKLQAQHILPSRDDETRKYPVESTLAEKRERTWVAIVGAEADTKRKGVRR